MSIKKNKDLTCYVNSKSGCTSLHVGAGGCSSLFFLFFLFQLISRPDDSDVNDRCPGRSCASPACRWSSNLRQAQIKTGIDVFRLLLQCVYIIFCIVD